MSSPVIRDVVVFFEDNAELLMQALDLAAERNEADAASLDETLAYESAVANVLRQSAASRRRMAAEISDLYERIADSDLEYAEQIGRGY